MSTLRPSSRPLPLQRNRARSNSKSVKQVQDDQLSLLNNKSLEEVSLLDDMRDFVKKRAALDKEYADQLSKLASTTIAKRKWPQPAMKLPGGSTHNISYVAWKTLLENTDNIAKQRSLSAELLLNQISDPIKPARMAKVAASRKEIEFGHKLQEELNKSHNDTEKAKKQYYDLQKVAQLAQEKYDEAKEAQMKKKTSFLQSKKDLEKKCSKADSKLELCNRRSQAARHVYALSLEATNSHIEHYYMEYLPELMKQLDGDFFESLTSYFSSYANVELEASKYIASCTTDIDASSKKIDRDFESQIFLLEQNMVFQRPPILNFEPVPGDTNSELVLDQFSKAPLYKEAGKLSAIVVRNNHKCAEKNKTLTGLLSMSDVYSKQPEFATAEAQAETLSKIDELRDDVRMLLIQSLKAKAKLNKMAEVGINIEEIRIEEKPGDDDASETGSLTTGMSGYDDDGVRLTNRRPSSVIMSSKIHLTAVALYDYQANTDEELSIAEDEVLTIFEQDGDGWCCGANAQGQMGLFPASYVEISLTGGSDTIDEVDENSEFGNGLHADLSSEYELSQNLNAHNNTFVRVSSMSHLENAQTSTMNASSLRSSISLRLPSPPSVAYTSPSMSPVQLQSSPTANMFGDGNGNNGGGLRRVRALYDNSAAEEDDDLYFSEGDIIEILEEGQDGFLKGRLNGKTGYFQDFLVESLDSDESDEECFSS